MTRKNVIYSNMNPLHKESQRLNIHFNTRFRDNYENSSPSDFVYTFRQPITNVLSLKLLSIDIVSSWYMIDKDDSTSTFNLQYNYKIPNVDMSNVKVKMDEGNFLNIDNFLGVLQPIIETSISNETFQLGPTIDVETITLPNGTPIINTSLNTSSTYPRIEFNINEYNLKSIFTITFPRDTTDISNIRLFFWDDNNKISHISRTLGWNLGFRKNEYLIHRDMSNNIPISLKDVISYSTDVNGNHVYSVVSEGLFDAGTDRYLFFSLDDYINNSINAHHVMLKDNILDNNIIGKVNIFEGAFGINVQDYSSVDNAKQREYHGMVDIKKIHVRIYNEFGEIINLHNMDFAFTLEFEQLYNTI